MPRDRVRFWINVLSNANRNTRNRKAGRRSVLRVQSLEDRVVPDGSGPRVTLTTPAEFRNMPFDHLDVQFNEAIDFSTFTAADAVVRDPSGAVVSVTGVSEVDSDTARLTVDPQLTRGTYAVVVGPQITDLAGNPMDQNQNGVNGEATADQFSGSVLVIQADVTFTSPTTIGESDTTYEGQSILIDGTTVAIDGPHHFKAVQLVNGAVLTHSANTADATHKLDLTVDEQVIVSSNSRVDVTGKGYLPGRTTGNTTVGGAAQFNAGSFGGWGWGSQTNNVYGDYADPADWGSGGLSNGVSSASAGGGQVRITATTMVLDGRVLANAGTANYPGSGGGVYLAVGTLRGVGSVQAAGGSGDGGTGGGGGRVAVVAADTSGFDTASISAPGGTGGGPGTVYLRNPAAPTGTLVIDAGLGGNGPAPLGLPGQSTFTVPDTVLISGGRTSAVPVNSAIALDFQAPLAIQSGATLAVAGNAFRARSSLAVNSSGTLQVAGQIQVDGSLAVAGGMVVTDHVVVPDASLSTGGRVTTFAASAIAVHELTLDISGTLTVDPTSAVDVAFKGYLPGRTSGNTTVGGATGSAGGSYGGRGKGGNVAVYGDYRNPSDWGAGGAAPGGGTGGGLVRVTAGTVVLDGTITAVGGGSGNGAGGGAGGGVYLSADTLRGAGVIDASGGAGSGSDGGGGGGGRVAVYVRDTVGFDLAKVRVYGGSISNVPPANNAGAGTFYRRNPADPAGTLTIDDAARATSGFTPLGLPTDSAVIIPDAVVIRGGGTQVGPDHTGQTITFANTVTVSGQAVLILDGETRVTDTGSVLTTAGGLVQGSGILNSAGPVTVDGGRLEPTGLVAPSLTVLNSGTVSHPSFTGTQVYGLDIEVSGTVAIDATSSISVSGRGYGSGRTTGNTLIGGADPSAGGSHGGRGGNGPSTFDDPSYPDDAGGGGGPGSTTSPTAGGAGGGRLHLVAGTLSLNGTISADGVGGFATSGGGAGGGVLLDVGILKGTGSITAAGGYAPANGQRGGGGGGRIAVYYRDNQGFNLARLTATGGNGDNGAPGGQPGSVFVLHGSPYTHVRSHEPAGVNVGVVNEGNGFVNAPITSVTLKTNKPLDLTTFSPSDFEITGQMGPLTPIGISLIGDRTYQIELPVRLTENGIYHFRLASAVRDTEGFPLDQNLNGVPGEPDDDYTFDLTVDTVPPRVVAQDPTGDVAGTISFVDVSYSEAIDLSSFTTSDVTITKPDSQSVIATGITNVGFNRYRITFPAQTLVGTYHVRVGPDIRDRAGNKLDQDRDGIFGEPGDDVYDASLNLLQVNLGLNNLQVSPTDLWAGEPVSVSWNGANQTGVALAGNWIDAVYLSHDDKWDKNDVPLATVPHTGGLATGDTYSGSVTVNLPGELPGNYHVLVRADVANQERETDEADNLIASAGLPLAVRPVSESAPADATLTPDRPSHFYTFHVDGGTNVAVSVSSPATGGANELYASVEAIPTRLVADYASRPAETELVGVNRSLFFTAPPGGGNVYVLVYGAQIDGSTDYTLRVASGPFFIGTLTPNRGTNRAPSQNPSGPSLGRVIPTTVTIQGAGFDPVTVIQFIDAHGGVHTPTATHFVSSSTLTLDLDLTSWPAGTYDVRIVKGATEVTQPAAFTVVPGGTPHLVTRIVAPSVMAYRVQTPQIIWIEYQNTGAAPMPAPLLKFHADMEARVTADHSIAYPTPAYQNLPASVTDTVQVYATGSGATPGILQPGDSGRIPVYYLGRGFFPTHQMNFTVTTLTADDVSWSKTVTAPTVVTVNGVATIQTTTTTTGEDWHVEWPAAATRPESIPQDAWDAVTANLQSELGTEWGDYVVALSQNANALHALGQDTQDVGQMWNFQVAQASASIGPVQYLTGAVDASEPAPGLPLTFSRTYGNTIVSRYRLGSLGRGWSTNWDVSAQTLSTGDVVLRGPGGVDRFFTKNPNGTYTGGIGDHGVLTLGDGFYDLVETDQTHWHFRSDGKLDFVQDTNGNRISLGYAGGLLTSLTHSSGKQLLLAYNPAGRLVSVTDPVGPGPADDRVTTYEYDGSGEHLVRVVAPGDRVTAYTYDTGTVLPRRHALTSVTYADDTHSFFTFDDRGRLTETSADGGAERVRYAYDSTGGVTVTDATNRTTFLAYGLNGRLEQVRDGDGRIVDLTNCSCGHVTQIVGPGGEKYSYSYDANGNLTGITDPLRQQTSFTYDPLFNQLTSVTDPRGNGIRYGYDSHGNLKSITYADNTHEDYTYDSKGNVLTDTNRRGQVITYTYNAGGQVLTKDYSTTPGVTDFVYTYDPAGNLSTARDATGTTTLTYDPVTQFLTRIDFPGGHFFVFTYDSVGRRTSRTDEAGHAENYFYDAAGRLDHMTDESGKLIVTYAYDDAGRLARKTLGNGVYTTYEYDAAGDVLHLVNFEPDGSVLSRFDYTYDGSGRRSSMATLDETQTYGYDPLGQLTSVAYSDGLVVNYAYDPAGNRVQVTDDGTTTAYATNNLNQYTTVGGATYTYDADGNMKTKTEGGVTTTYTYDAENYLVGVTTPTDTWVYTYDAFGNRIGSTHNGVATTYVIDPTGLGNVAAEFDGGGQAIARYDDGYGLLARTDAAGNAAYYTFSAIGDTSELTSASGGVLNSYTYDPFGISLGKTETVSNPFAFVGEYGVMDDDNGLSLMRARSFDVQVGRFAQIDPKGIAAGVNLYSYAKNSPSFYIDPSGLSSSDDIYQSIEAGIDGAGELAGEMGMHGLEGTCMFFGWMLLPYNGPVDETLPGLRPHYPAHPDRNDPSYLTPEELTYWEKAANERADRDEALRRIQGQRCNPSPPPGQPPIPPPGPGPGGSAGATGAADPNDKLAPAGFGDAAFVQPDGSLAYQVLFENEADATAPAHEIVVSDTLDPGLDLATFELTGIEFANQSITIPAGLDHYETKLPITANGVALLVDVQASLDRVTRTFTLDLRTIDPATGWFPEDPLLGLLYPEDGTGRGVGSVSYDARPLAGLPSGTLVQNRATIVFDYNDPIDTPLVHNTLDVEAPTSSVTTPSGSTAATTLDLQWAGQDETGGSGIASYDVFVSVDGGVAQLLFDDVTATSGSVAVLAGHTYSFYSVATDNVGHVEAAPSSPHAVITVADSAPTLDPIGDRAVDEGQTVSFTATASDPDAGQFLRFSLDSGAPAAASIDPVTGVFTWPTTEDDGPGVYPITVRVTDDADPARSAFETILVTVHEVNTAPVVDPVGDLTLHEDDGPQTVTLTGVSAGPGNEATLQTVTITATSDNPALIPDPTVNYAGGATGSLVFHLVPDANGVATITLTVRDDGGTAFGGADTFTETFTVTVLAEPDRPVIDVVPTPMFPAIRVPTKPAPTGEPIGDLVTHVTDPDAGATKGVAVTAADTANGKWQYNLTGADDGWTDLPGVSDTGAFLLADDGVTRIRFVPKGRFKSGFAGISYRAWDQSDALAPGNLADASVAGGDGAFSLDTERAWVAVGKTKPQVDVYGHPLLTPVREDRHASTPVAVRSFLGLLALETDPAKRFGIAVDAVDETGGTWQFNVGKGGWQDVGAVTDAAALLLRPTDRIRFLPAHDFDGRATLTYHTWDLTGGKAGTKVPATGGAFSAATETAIEAMIPVNDAPVLDTTPGVTLNPVAAGQTTNEVSFGSILSATDVDGPALGVAVVGASGPGTWQYRPAGGDWTDLGRVSIARALFLTADAEIRFTATASAKPGTASLSYKAWDRSTGTAGHFGPARGTAVSLATEVLTAAVANTAPSLDTSGAPTLTPVKSGQKPGRGDLVGRLLGRSVTDPDPHTLAGLAVTGIDDTNGTWQYSLGGNRWADVGPVSPTDVLLLPATARLRFVPAAGFVGAATINYRAWDRSAGQAGDRLDPAGLDSFSLDVATATVTVTP